MTIVVGYTATARGRRALEEAKAHARVRQAPLHLVRYIAHEVGESPTKIREDMRTAEHAEEELEAARGRLEEAGLRATTAVLHGIYGGAADAVLSEAERTDAELVVIGIRRRSAVGKVVLGSVAQDILLRADCAVLAVKAD